METPLYQEPQHFEITRTYEISASHHLPTLPDDHKCARQHGHNFRITLTIAGALHPVHNWVVDYAALDRVWEKIHEQLDHSNLNDVIPNPTSEMIAGWIYSTLVLPVANIGARLAAVRIEENGRCSATLRVESPHAKVP